MILSKKFFFQTQKKNNMFGPFFPENKKNTFLKNHLREVKSHHLMII